MLETVLALGITPVAATELIQFRQIAVEPPVPAATADLGLRGTPNFELLRIAAPDLILISNFYEYQRPILERIAPVYAAPLFLAAQPPFAPAQANTLALGEKLGRAGTAAAFVAEVEAELDAWRKRLHPHAERPVFLVSIGDSRHFRAFGGDSMVGNMLSRLGFRNAWMEDTSYSAAAPVGIEALARVPEAGIVVIPPVPPEARGLSDSALWNALPAVREGRVWTLASLNHFGGLPSARRFARLFGQALLRKSSGNG